MKRRYTAAELDSALKTWHSLDAVIMDASEGDAVALLEREKARGRRIRILLRIHSRITKLRGRREVQELMELSTGGDRGGKKKARNL